MIKNRIRKVLLSEKNVGKSTFVWNAFAAMMNSFQTTVLAIILTRKGNIVDSSIFFMAYAVANLMLNIGKYGVRQYQVTDIREKYKYNDYLTARYITLGIMIIASVGYVIYSISHSGYSLKKSLIVLLICLFKSVEAFEDVLHGRMQQKGRLDTASKILGIRLFVYLILFTMVYLISEDLTLTILINLVFTIVLSVILNGSVYKTFILTERFSWINVKGILIECFPLCVSTCLNIYVANAPKYIIDTIVTDEQQSAFNIVFMPVFIIALLGTFIFQPSLKKLGELWEKRERQEMLRKIGKLSGITMIIAVIVIAVGSFIGIPVLEAVYGIDLRSYRTELILFMISGSIIALHNLLIMIITTVRYQKYMIWGYVVLAIMFLCFGKYVLISGGLSILAVFFLLMLIFLMIYFILLVAVALQKAEKGGSNV